MEEAEMGSFFSQLPVEITTDILSRLPVGSVILCKLVCKAWRSFVEDPVFLDIHSHLLLSKPDADADVAVTTNTGFYYFFIVRQLQENRQQKHHFGECSNNHEMSSNSCFKLSKPLNAAKDDDDSFSKWYHRHPIGSSNGLICSYGLNRETIYVYNPCTRECVRLSPPPMPITKQFNSLIFSGFGYNPLTNEYKVVLIRQEGITQLRAEVCVYTLGSGKWRTNKQLESCSLHVPTYKPGVFFNGALHWITSELINTTDHYNIFSFDLANEEFRIIVPSPPLSDRFYVELGLWGGCYLCARQWNIVTKTTDIWMLMNNKDKDIKSWTMKFNIPAAATDYKFRFHYPIVLLGREKILLYTYKEKELVFVTYNSGTGNFEDELVVDYSELQPSESNWSHFSVIPCTKSFVSLKPFGEEDAGLPF